MATKKNHDPYKEELKGLTENLRASAAPTPKLLRGTLDLFSRIQPSLFGKADEELVRKAFEYARAKHAKQKRASGEPYIVHLLETAKILAGYELGAEIIVAGLLHDVLEDTDVDVSEFKKTFGPTIFRLVDGVSRLDQLSRNTPHEEAAYLQKMFMASSDDLRVLIIKLADKLHNMRTLHYLPKARRTRISKDVLDVYAPLAHKLGIFDMEKELGDLALKNLEPAVYKELKKKLIPLKKAKKAELQEIVHILEKHEGFAKEKPRFEIRERSVYEVHRKMELTGKSLDEIYDYVRLLVLPVHTHDCYHALHVIHSTFHPLPKKFKDFIASPRSPTYQALHTSAVGPNGNPVRIYIRTRRMDELAREGVVAWVREARFDKTAAKQLTKFFKMDVDQDMEYEAFLESLRADVLPFNLYIFSPTGGRIGVPAGSTVLDYVFQEYGKKALSLRQGYINDRPVPPWTLLNEGDRVTLAFYRHAVATPDWMDYATTYKARQLLGDIMPRPGKKKQTGHPVALKVKVHDRVGMLRDLCDVFARQKINIDHVHVYQVKAGQVYMDKFTFFIPSKKKFHQLVEMLGKVKGVVNVESDFN